MGVISEAIHEKNIKNTYIVFDLIEELKGIYNPPHPNISYDNLKKLKYKIDKNVILHNHNKLTIINLDNDRKKIFSELKGKLVLIKGYFKKISIKGEQKVLLRNSIIELDNKKKRPILLI